MARIFITGSADGLGKWTAQSLVPGGHTVILHARHEKRGGEALAAIPGAGGVITGDLSSIKETIEIAERVNGMGVFDAVIHNAGVGYGDHKKIMTVDGLAHIFAINALAPYLLTSLIEKPKRLIYISSGLHRQGNPAIDDIGWQSKPWNASNAYADSKLYNVLLAFAVARKWPAVFSNAVDPGWVPTKMGGRSAPDSPEDGVKTQVWLATSDDEMALVSGQYFYHKKPRVPVAAALDQDIQERFLEECRKLSGISLPV